MRAAALVVALMPFFACSSSDDKTRTLADCNAIADQIRTAAPQHGFNPTGICNNPDAQKDFGQACAALKDCNDHCCK